MTYYVYQMRKGHPLEQCVTFRTLFNEKHKASEIRSQEGWLVNINESSFPKHQDIRKGQVMMVPNSEKEVEGLQPKVKPNLENMP